VPPRKDSEAPSTDPPDAEEESDESVFETDVVRIVVAIFAVVAVIAAIFIYAIVAGYHYR
jgi:hypothetical protein